MASRVLRFHFDYLSPYSYLAWIRLPDLAARYDLRIEPKPTLLAALLNHHGHRGPGEIEGKRLYMFMDCLRAATLIGAPYAPPFSHPFNPVAPLRATLLDMDAQTRIQLVSDLFDATWAHSRDVSSPEVVNEICASAGVPDAAERIRDPAIKQRLWDASKEAIDAGLFGVPTMIVDAELFWGTDSFVHLERFLAGNDPVRPEDVERWNAIPRTAER